VNSQSLHQTGHGAPATLPPLPTTLPPLLAMTAIKIKLPENYLDC